MIPEEQVMPTVPPAAAVAAALPSRRRDDDDDDESMSDLKWRDILVARFNDIAGVGLPPVAFDFVFVVFAAGTTFCCTASTLAAVGSIGIARGDARPVPEPLTLSVVLAA